MRVGDLLARHSELAFYADDYLRALNLVSRLDARFNEFLAALPGNDTSAEEHIDRMLAAGELRHIPAYAPYTSARELPFIDKTDLRARTASFQSGDTDAWIKMTTGTTGAPVPILYDAAFYFEALLLSHVKIAARAAIPISATPVFCVGINDKKASEEIVVADPCGRTGLSVQLHVDERNPASFERAIAMLLDIKPLCITSKPSLLDQFCSIADSRGARIGRDLAFVVCSGSALRPQARARIEDCFRTRVVDAYTMTEFGLIASECAAAGMHIDASAVAVECAEDGELTISSVRNPAMPLLRYRTGDFATAGLTPCACGSRAPRLIGLEGKQIACFRFPGGVLFSPTFFNDLLSRFPEFSEFQITQESDARFHVVVEPPAADAAAMERMRVYIEDSLPGHPRVTIESRLLDKGRGFRRYCSEP
jgi:phenylacetate-coenzyme A ligase PaaK-like adenylate-forming protein